MEVFFIQLANMSIQAAIVVCIILVARFFLERLHIPRKYIQLLWIIPFFRMVFPWRIESVFSLLPDKTAILSQETAFYHSYNPEESPLSGVHLSNYGDTNVKTNIDSISTGHIVLLSLFFLWLVIGSLFLMYSIISYTNLKRKLQCSVKEDEIVYYADHIDTPFVFGVIHPRIYIPSDLQGRNLSYVITHERVHIRRKDHLIKILAYIVASIHWFNPFAWIAFRTLGKDMEMSCDEEVLRIMGEDCRESYARELIELSSMEHHVTPVPLAFGEENPKRRIKNIMKHKKPLVISLIVAFVLIIVLFFGFMTSQKRQSTPSEENHGNEIESTELQTEANATEISATEIGETEEWIAEDESARTFVSANDFAKLDFADEKVIIFHSSSELYMYGIQDRSLLFAVRLDGTKVAYYCQNDEDYQVSVVKDEKDGSLSEVSMLAYKWIYDYDVKEGRVTEPLSSAYDRAFEGLNNLKITDECVEPDPTVYRSEYCVEIEDMGKISYLYLESKTGLMEDLCYVWVSDGKVMEEKNIFQAKCREEFLVD